MSVLVEASGIVLQDDISSNPFFSSLFERLTACIVTVFIFAVSYFLSEYCDFPSGYRLLAVIACRFMRCM